MIILLFQVLLRSQEGLIFLLSDSLVYPNTVLSRVMLSADVDRLGVPFLACSLPFLQAYSVPMVGKKGFSKAQILNYVFIPAVNKNCIQFMMVVSKSGPYE